MSHAPHFARGPLLGLALLASLTACKKDEKDTADEASREPAAKDEKPAISAAEVHEQAKGVFKPLPEVAKSEDNPITEEKVALGRMLYYDPRFSKSEQISCNTCHDLDEFGIDVRETEGSRDRVSLGHEDQPGERNSPTVYNAAIQVAQFWDGRSEDVEEQAKGPILNPIEMAMGGESEVLEKLGAIPGYKQKFEAAFPDAEDSITFDNMAKAIGAFERKLMTPAPFDAFLEGDMAALDQNQLRGLELFMDVGCITCHVGPGVGGSMFQKLGTVKPYETEDLGRYEVTKKEADKYVFKVPLLRNVTKTAPYMHDGSIDDLEQVVQVMAEHQTSKGKLAPDEVDAIIAFLGSLTGEIPKDYIAKPDLPGLEESDEADEAGQGEQKAAEGESQAG